MTILNRDQLTELYTAELYVQPVFSAEEYVCVDRDWFFDGFGPIVGENLKLLGVRYVKGVYECVQFARLARALADLCHLRAYDVSAVQPPRVPLAIGSFGFTRFNTNVGHAAICAVAMVEGKPALLYLEPQSGKELSIWPEERQTCMEAYL